MTLKNKIIPWPDGQQYYIAGEKSTDDPQRRICLLNPLDKEPDYKLWNVAFSDDEEGKVKFWPYDGADSNDLIIQLLEDLVEHAFEK